LNYQVLTLTHAGGEEFVALGPDNAITASQPDAGGPYAALSSGWLYAVGQAPRLRCGRVGAAAEGTRVVMHTIAGGGNTQRVRVILLNGSGVSVTYDGLDRTRLATDNSYVDGVIDMAGDLVAFGNVAPFDRDATEGSMGIMDEIDAARQQYHVD
jgi:hypothetical protein